MPARRKLGQAKMRDLVQSFSEQPPAAYVGVPPSPTPGVATPEVRRRRLPLSPRGRVALVVMVMMIAAIAGFAAQQIASAPIQVLDVAGNIQPAKQTLLDFGVSGVVQSVDVKPGQSVAAGAVLARLDNVTAGAQVKQAQDAVFTAEAKLRLDAESSPAAQAQAQAVIAVANDQLAESAAEANYADTARLNQLGVQAAQLADGGGVVDAATGQVQLGAAASNLADIQRNGAATVAADQLAVQSATAIGQGSVNAAAVQVATLERILADEERVSQKNIALAQAGVTAAQAKVTADQARLSCDNGSTPPSPTCTPNSTNVSADQAALAADQAAVKSPQANLAQVQATAKLDNNTAAAAVANAQATLKDTQIAANVAVKSAQAALAQAVSQAKAADDQAQAQLAASENGLQQAQARGQQSNDLAAEQLAAARLALQTAQQALASLPRDAVLLLLEQDQASVDAAQSVLAVVQHTLDRGSIVAPVAGIVDQVSIKAGDTAAPPLAGTLTHAIVLETPNAFQLTAPVRDSIITRVQRGALVQVVPAGSSQTLTGSVTDIAPSATIRTGSVTTFDVTATFEAKGVDVRPGMSARMRISLTPVAGGESQPTASPVPGEGSAAPSPSASASSSSGFPELPTLPPLPTEGVPGVPTLPSIPTLNPGSPLVPSPAALPVR